MRTRDRERMEFAMISYWNDIYARAYQAKKRGSKRTAIIALESRLMMRGSIQCYFAMVGEGDSDDANFITVEARKICEKVSGMLSELAKPMKWVGI